MLMFSTRAVHSNFPLLSSCIKASDSLDYLTQTDFYKLIYLIHKDFYEQYFVALTSLYYPEQAKKIIPLKRANLNYFTGTDMCFLHREFAKYSTEF